MEIQAPRKLIAHDEGFPFAALRKCITHCVLVVNLPEQRVTIFSFCMSYELIKLHRTSPESSANCAKKYMKLSAGEGTIPWLHIRVSLHNGTACL